MIFVIFVYLIVCLIILVTRASLSLRKRKLGRGGDRDNRKLICMRIYMMYYTYFETTTLYLYSKFWYVVGTGAMYESEKTRQPIIVDLYAGRGKMYSRASDWESPC